MPASKVLGHRMVCYHFRVHITALESDCTKHVAISPVSELKRLPINRICANCLKPSHARYLYAMIAAARILAVFIIVVEISFNGAARADAVKMSVSGLCHPPESRWYERTSNYTAYDSIKACLAASGRLPQGMNLRDIRATRSTANEYRSYDRDAFRHWVDSDSDCQDTRAELLISQSTTEVRFAKENVRCRVIAGRWISPFTGKVIQNSDAVEIDHVVALKWAWERGAWRWPDNERERFANDPVNIMAVEASLNSQKRARSPDKWLPPSAQCGYVARFRRVANLYDLEPTTSEAMWMKSFLDSCRT